MTEHKHTGLYVLLVLLLIIVAAQGALLLSVVWHGARDPGRPATASKAQVDSPRLAPLEPDVNWPGFSDDWWAEMERLQERISRWMDDAFNRLSRMPAPSLLRQRTEWFAPRMDLKDEGDRYVVRFDVPGADKSKLSVQIEDRVLTVTGESGEAVEERRGDQYLRLERRVGRFQRSIVLPGPVDADRMEARYENGVLTVIVPKSSKGPQTRSIRIS